MIPATNFRYFWDTLVNPRLGHAGHAPDAYVWGGSFSADDIDQGTDCSGAVSAELSAMVRGAGCIYQRQFYTGTFAGADPGDHGPWGGVSDTRDLVCIAHPNDAAPGAAMIIAIRQMADPTDAHMICSVPTSVGGPWTTIEMGGPPDNYHLGVTAIDNPEFNQWFYLPGPIEGAPAPPPPPPQLSRADRYAVDIIGEGQRRGITPRGIQIALATALVESNLTMYANSNDPASLQLPHDAVGSDHMSTGIFQQQNFAPWGTLECRMNAACSAGLFYAQLVKHDYNNPDSSPGSYAQAVQGSAFPDRYDQRFGDAVALYTRLAGTQPQPLPQPPGEDDWLNMPSNQQMLQDIWSAFFTPQPPENIYRSAAEVQGDAKNLVDSIKSILSMVYEGVVERCAFEVGEQASIDKVVRTARGQGPEQRPWAVQRAYLIWQRAWQRASSAAAVHSGAVTAISPPAPAGPDMRDVELSNAYTEIGRLRAEIAQLQALPAAPVGTEVAKIEPKAPTLGESVGGKVDADQEWAKVSLALDKVQQHALDVSIQGLKMQTNGTEQ